MLEISIGNFIFYLRFFIKYSATSLLMLNDQAAGAAISLTNILSPVPIPVSKLSRTITTVWLVQIIHDVLFKNANCVYFLIIFVKVSARYAFCG